MDLALKNIITSFVRVVVAPAVAVRLLRLRVLWGRLTCLHERLEMRPGAHGSQEGAGPRYLWPWHLSPVPTLVAVTVSLGGNPAVAPEVEAIAELPPSATGGSPHPYRVLGPL